MPTNLYGGFGADDPNNPSNAPVQMPPPTLNPAPIYSDPANGPAPATAPSTSPDVSRAAPPDPAAVFKAAPAQGAGGPPDPAAVYAAGPQTATETTSSTTTSGMSDRDIKEQRGQLDTAQAAQAKATGSELEARRVDLQQQEQEQTRLLNEAAEEQKKIAAKQAVVDLQESEVKKKLQAGADWRPDRTELFEGGAGAARGILAAVSVIAGGLMQGRGMTRDNPFLGSIERMIDDNVADQVRQNSATMQFLREQKGDIHAAAAELKARQMQFAVQKMNAKAALSKLPAAQAGLTAFNDAASARTAEWRAEQEKALRKQVSATISRHTAPVGVMGAGEAGSSKAAGERSPEQAKAEAAQQAINAFGEKAGLIRDKSGKWITGKGALPPALIEKINPFSDNEIKAHADAAVEAFGRLQSGGVIGDDEREAFRDQLGMNTTTRDQLAQRLNAADNALNARLRAADAAGQHAAITPPPTWRRLGVR